VLLHSPETRTGSTTEETLVAEMIMIMGVHRNERIEFIIGSYWRRVEMCISCKRPVEVYVGGHGLGGMKPFAQYTCVPCNTALEAIRRNQ